MPRSEVAWQYSTVSGWSTVFGMGWDGVGWMSLLRAGTCNRKFGTAQKLGSVHLEVAIHAEHRGCRKKQLN